MARFANILLVAAILIPGAVLVQRHETPMLIIAGIIAAILIFFTVLIRGMLKRGAHSAPELYGRTMTFWWMLAGFLVAETTPRIFAYLLMGALCWVSWLEYLSLLPQWRASGEARISGATRFSAALALAAAGAFAYYGAVGGFLLAVPAVAFGLLPIVFVCENQTRDTVAVLGYLGLGLMFFLCGLGHGLLLLNLGAMALVYCFFLTELRDLFSYWIGKGLAKLGPQNILNAKIAPAVSPNKAWGAGILSILFTAGLSVALVPLLPDFPLGRLSPGYAAFIGLVVGTLGLFGDLVFSLVKRDIGVKDSGHGLPGGTGAIDRIDSLVFTLPAVFHLIYWMYF